MDLARLFSLRNADIEIVKRTVTEEYPEKNLKSNRNNNTDNRPPCKKTHNETTGQISNGDCAEFTHPVREDDAVVDNDDFVVIELVDEEDLAIEEQNRDSFVDIDLQSSKQLLVYLSRKKRHLITCRTRAVSHTPLVKKFSTGLIVAYLQPFFRLTISNTELWYITHRSSIYHRPPRRSIKRRPFHYTEKVECDDTISSHNTSKILDASGIQLTFSDERSGGVSTLTLSGDFTKSYEERHSKLHDVSRDIEAEEKAEPGLLKRSYSIEFLNEDKAKDDSTSAEYVAQQIEQGNARDIYADSIDEGSYSSTNLLDSTCETKSLKRSFSIEFLNEANDEDKPFSSEMVHYKIDKGEGVLVYTDIQVNDKIEQSSSHANENDQPSTLKRSYSIEFLDESENNRSAFTYETVSNKIEKGEGRLVYDDSNINGDLGANSPKKIKRKANKLKTLSIDMDVNDDGSMVPLSKQPKAYSIEMLNEMGDKAVPIVIEDEVESAPPSDDVFDDEIVATEIVADETEQEIDFFGDDFNFAEEQPNEGNLNVEKRSYNVEFLDEKPNLTLVFDNNMTSTPTKNTPSSPKKSPLQTVHVGLEFEKRNKSENDEDELFVNDGDEYLLYEDSSTQKNGRIGSNGGHRIPSFKLKTVVVDMETHHKVKRPSLQHDRKYQLEFQTERERRISMLRDARKARIPSSPSASLRTVSIETGEEEIIHFEDELKPVEVLKKKAYSVEYLNEMEGDRSVFYEELVDDGELRWTMEC